MVSLTLSLVPLILAGLLGRTGAAKLGPATVRAAPKTALARMLGNSERAVLALRGVGTVELVLALGLFTQSAWPAAVGLPAATPGAGAALLGAGFLAYLARARTTAPESSCGCSANDDSPITWRAFARAAAVLAGGAVAGAAATGDALPWWEVFGRQPVASAAFVLVSATVLVALSADLDRWWRLPLRRFRLRLSGHPFGATAGTERVPVEATVELLERSLAWQATGPVVRSGLVDHWDEDGWRILRYNGVYEAAGQANPVLVLFALDATVSMDTTTEPAVRVSVVDADSGQPVAQELLSPVSRTALPLVG
ncbi:hypothetical protein JL475_38180 [Streptomyces sp. M2CJ-2]|uniref:MauE/DoxX family redox-associated membrane protein n=1 Tax=Streptomyces sp. M2CJ-2 TaxID=2803948 RepID=UPI001926AB85|nr:MauE/DoxX family redox-associated membrane protein [Streptomyces sp. M2CJ-2]MBL3671597.1 hypothetical protein [Streptomyces sp. M2CJ-2]